MEAIASDARACEMSRQCKRLRHLRLATMECCVEAGNLWDVWCHIEDCLNGGQVVRLVQGREWRELRKRRQHSPVQSNRCTVSHPAMYNAMSDASHGSSRDQSRSRCQYLARRRVVVEPF